MPRAKTPAAAAKPKLSLAQQIKAAKSDLVSAQKAVTSAGKAKAKADKVLVLAFDKLEKLQNKQRAVAAK